MAGLFGGSRHTETSDTKLSSFRMQTATFGLPIPIIFGTTRMSGNIIDYTDFTATSHTETQSSGKGGGSSSSHTSYTYDVAVAIGIGEGPIEGVGKVWNDKAVVSLSSLKLALMQDTPWAYMSSKHPERALPYHKFAYVAGYIALGDSDSLPNISMEVKGKYLSINSPFKLDCEVVDVFKQMLTNIQWGLALPETLLGDWSSFATYTRAAGIWFSYNLANSVATNSLLEDMMKTCNSEFVASEGVLKIVPYCESTVAANGVTFGPNITIQYNFDDDSILCDGNAPAIRIERVRYDDTSNSVSLEIINRAKDYNVDAVEWSDPTDSVLRGAISATSMSAHWIPSREMATMIARTIVWRNLYNRNKYIFTVPYDYYLLEPMDIVSITDERMMLDHLPVRVKKITETEGGLEIEAEDVFKFATSPVYSSAGTPSHVSIDHNVAPGNINPPTMLVASPAITTSGGYEGWIMASGDNSNWGGCSVHVSFDNISFSKVGTITNPSRHGTLNAELPTLTPTTVGSTLDATNTISVKAYTGQLLSGTPDDRDFLRTLLFVDGELISYQTATLAGAGTYNLTSLRRGAYGTTIKNHAAGTKWGRLDSSIFKCNLDSSYIGRTLYLKFTSFNVFGGNEQELSAVSVYTLTATPVGAYTPPARVDDTTPSSTTVYSSRAVETRMDAVANRADARINSVESSVGDVSTALTSIIGG